MNIDRYTKIILTIIAVSLTVISVRTIIKPSLASDQIMKVILCDKDDQNSCATIAQTRSEKVAGSGIFRLAIVGP
jgi:hypothetical protein